MSDVTGPVDGPAHHTGQARVGDTFARLCEIPSPSGQEGAMGAAVRAELEAIGLAVTEDDTAAETGAGCGNLLARIPGPPGARTVMLCAHIDTVPLTDRVEVELVDGVYRNRRDAILGADDKAGVAVILEARAALGGLGCALRLRARLHDRRGGRAAGRARVRHGPARGRVRLRARPRRADRPHGGGRTDLLRGACASSWDAPRTRASGPRTGAARSRPRRKAVESMRLGRIDEETTANVGVIGGGVAANVVPERCTIEAEVRSLDDGKASEAVHAMVDTITWAASATETDVDTTIEEHFRAYRIPESDPTVVIASAAHAGLRGGAGAGVHGWGQRRERVRRQGPAAA